MKINFNYQDVYYTSNIEVKSGFPKAYHITSVVPGILELRYPLVFEQSFGGMLATPDVPGYPGLGETIGCAIVDAGLTSE